MTNAPVTAAEFPADPSDILALDSLLGAEELRIRQRVRDFTDQRIKPDIARWYEDAVFPLELAQE
ncbi:MAG TPA: acyl-CoA dehydrogenase family protein, partial [Arthrobacter sp.]